MITIAFGTVYSVAQQILRMGANDPQIQLAEDRAASLNSGAAVQSLLMGKVLINQSLASFVQVYDTKGYLIAGDAYLSGQQPTVPFGVLSAADGSAYSAVTWQPATGVRIAAVAVKASNYYVVAGRNLVEVEKRQDKALLLSSLGWAAICIVFALGWIMRFYGAEGRGKGKRA